MHASTRLAPGAFRSAVIACVALSALSLTGCTNSDFSLTSEDALGTWRAGSNLPAQMDLAEDGVFTATDWPVDVGCNAGSPGTAKALQGAETADFSGTWEEGAGGSLNALTFHPDLGVCSVHSFTAEFRSEDGVKYACIGLGVPNELSSAENYFILYLGEPEETPRSNACFSYN